MFKFGFFLDEEKIYFRTTIIMQFSGQNKVSSFNLNFDHFSKEMLSFNACMRVGRFSFLFFRWNGLKSFGEPRFESRNER